MASDALPWNILSVGYFMEIVTYWRVFNSLAHSAQTKFGEIRSDIFSLMHLICYDEVGLITFQEVTRGCNFMSPGFI